MCFIRYIVRGHHLRQPRLICYVRVLSVPTTALFLLLYASMVVASNISTTSDLEHQHVKLHGYRDRV